MTTARREREDMMQAHDSEPMRARTLHPCVLCDNWIMPGDYYITIRGFRDMQAHAHQCPQTDDLDDRRDDSGLDDRLCDGWDMIHACDDDDDDYQEEKIVYKW